MVGGGDYDFQETGRRWIHAALFVALFIVAMGMVVWLTGGHKNAKERTQANYTYECPPDHPVKVVTTDNNVMCVAGIHPNQVLKSPAN